VVQAGRQAITWDWWETRRADFELFISDAVVREIARGDPDAAARRLELVESLPRLTASGEAIALAKALVNEGAVPGKAVEDAFHIALAAVHDMDYLLTWNYRHLANAEMQAAVRALLEREGWPVPAICLPEELLGDRNV